MTYSILYIDDKNIDKIKSSEIFIRVMKDFMECFELSNNIVDEINSEAYIIKNTKSNSKVKFRYFIVLQENIPIASARLEFVSMYKMCEIHNVCVPKKYRRQGYCNILMDLIHYFIFHKKKYNLLHVYCDSKNKPACKCYTKSFGDSIVVNKKIKIPYISKISVKSFYTCKSKHMTKLQIIREKYDKIKICKKLK